MTSCCDDEQKSNSKTSCNASTTSTAKATVCCASAPVPATDACCSPSLASATPAAAGPARGLKGTTFRIAAMDCASEESEIRRALEPVLGVRGLGFQLGARTLTIDASEDVIPQAVAAIRKAGFDPQPLAAAAPGDPPDHEPEAEGLGRKQPKNANEQSQFCNRAGCQYQGRALCAQPFCAEMNYLWSVDRAQRR